MQSIEKWLPVVGYEARYEVSDQGRVRSLDSIDSLGRAHAGQVLKPTPVPNGYLTVVLYSDGRKTHTVHRVVASAFHGVSGKPVVRHLDGTQTNNHASNLAWGTYADNTQDSLRHGTNNNARKTACIRGHEYTEQNTGRHARGRRYCKRCESNRASANYHRNKEIS